jgi:hypothetical protein
MAPFPRSQRIESAPVPVYVNVKFEPRHCDVDGEIENEDVGAGVLLIEMAFE